MTKLSGFSLIELMVAMGLLTSLSVVVLSISVSGTENFTFVQNTNQENTAFSDAFNRIDRNVRIAVSFPTSATSSDSSTTYNVSDPEPTLITRLNSVKTDNSLCPDQFDIVIYRIENNSLREIVIPSASSTRKATTQTLMTNLKGTSSMVQNINSGAHRTVTVSLTYEKTERGKTTARTRSQVMVARND